MCDNNFKHPYHEIYIGEIATLQANIFMNIDRVLPGVDERWFIENYMRSNVRRLLDEAWPRFVNMSSTDVILFFIESEMSGDYKRGEPFGGFILEWIGQFYSLYQYYYNIPSKQLIEEIPLNFLQSVFPTLHQASYKVATIKVHEIITHPTYRKELFYE